MEPRSKIQKEMMLGTRLTSMLVRQELAPFRQVVRPCTLQCRVASDFDRSHTPANLVVDLLSHWERMPIVQLHMVSEGDRIVFPLHNFHLLLCDPGVAQQLRRVLALQLSEGIIKRVGDLQHSIACLSADLCSDRPYIATTGLVERIKRIQQIVADLTIIQSKVPAYYEY